MSAPPCVERVEFEDYHLHFRLTSGRVKSGELTILCNVVSLMHVAVNVHAYCMHPHACVRSIDVYILYSMVRSRSRAAVAEHYVRY